MSKTTRYKSISSPNGYTCDSGRCKKGDIFVPYFKKTKSLSSPSKVLEQPIVCKDNSTCNPLSTCCKMTNGEYGCCKYFEAECCENHCCPKGLSCGGKFGECLPKIKTLKTNWHTIELKALKLDDDSSSFGITNTRDYVCPGGETQCNNGTCCAKADTTYSCCPYLNGTCCGTHGWCCPQDYTCDPKAEACIYNDDLKRKEKKSCNPDICSPTIHTCCTDGCCPLPDGNCCDNMTHCCPKDFKCHLADYSNVPVCMRDDGTTVDAVNKIPNF